MRKIIFTMVALCLISTGPVVSAEEITTAVVKAGVSGAFNELERQMIRKYFKENEYVHIVEDKDDYKGGSYKYKGKPKNKGKNKGLPPGIAKNLERGNLPPGLESTLPGKHDGYETVIVGDDVVLIEIDTGKIADILTDAVIGI